MLAVIRCIRKRKRDVFFFLKKKTFRVWFNAKIFRKKDKKKMLPLDRSSPTLIHSLTRQVVAVWQLTFFHRGGWCRPLRGRYWRTGRCYDGRHGVRGRRSGRGQVQAEAGQSLLLGFQNLGENSPSEKKARKKSKWEGDKWEANSKRREIWREADVLSFFLLLHDLRLPSYPAAWFQSHLSLSLLSILITKKTFGKLTWSFLTF